MRHLIFPSITALAAAATLLVSSPTANAEEFLNFENGCVPGNGNFNKPIGYQQEVRVGVIPMYKRSVSIALRSKKDVDVRLMDKETGEYIIGWFPTPNAILNGADPECTVYNGTTICYSGYNGITLPDGSRSLGEETITFEGDTNRAFVMTAFGYEADLAGAPVDYSWDVTPSCNEQGQQFFSKDVPHLQNVLVGVIPQGVYDVTIDLRSDKDVDVVLYDGDVELIHWHAGDIIGQLPLGGPTKEKAAYMDMSITYSGYNGVADPSGQQPNRGHERILIAGRVTRELTMKVFGYQAGEAEVESRWGTNIGATCLGIATLQCKHDLACKEVQTNVSDPAGVCHSPDWCDTNATAAVDCSNVPHIAVPGQWSCTANHTCSWDTGPSCALLQPPPANLCAEPWETYLDEDGCMKFMCPASYANIPLHAILSYPDDYDGELVAVTWKAVQSLPVCTKIACSISDPCCNGCGAQLQFAVTDANGDTNALSFKYPSGSVPTDFDCSGNSCEVVGGSCGGRGDKNIKVYGIVQKTQYGTNLLFHKKVDTDDVPCSLFDQTCPAATTCEYGCPTANNCGINPPGTCENVCAGDENLDYVADDLDTCMVIKYTCASGAGFSNACGCGCCPAQVVIDCEGLNASQCSSSPQYVQTKADLDSYGCEGTQLVGAL